VLRHAKKSTLYDDVMIQMVEAIKENHWSPGSKLPGEKTLAATFGVSRASVREVLKALAYTGVLEARPGQGTFLSINANQILSGMQLATTMLSGSSYTELMQIRQLLEGQAAYWATENATPEDIKRLEYILKGEERGESLFDIHDKFHIAIVEMSNNHLLIKLLNFLRDEIWQQREVHYSILPDMDRREHWKVLDAIKSGSPAKARRAMTQHVNFFWKKQYYDETGTSEGESDSTASS
jgi:GntR family transcriptional repressor for pyruvate dehydrogenase complex